jgi:hypothetical protein
MFGIICLFIRLRAGNFSFSTNATAAKNIYNSYKTLPEISKHVPKHSSNLTDNEFG